MKLAFALLLTLHGAIHLLGFTKAFGLAALPQLTTPISRALGIVWLLAALAWIASAALLFVSSESWWMPGAVALVLSECAIVAAWGDARFGTVVNAIALVPLALATLDARSTSFRSTFRRDAEVQLARAFPTPIVTDAQLAPLPPLVQTYLRRVGVVGRPRVHDFRARFRGQMKSAHDAPWMNVEVEQVEVFGEPARLFLVHASRSGVPFEALHEYVAGHASMRVRVLSLFEVVDARGPEMDRSETVTLFNDLCMLAPAALIDAPITWEPRGERRVRATYTNAGNTIAAELVFDTAGDLVDFVSYDRSQTSDGKTYLRYPWSTPLRDYRDFGGARIAASGDAIWREPTGDFVYARFALESIEYNVGTTSTAKHEDRAATLVDSKRLADRP